MQVGAQIDGAQIDGAHPVGRQVEGTHPEGNEPPPLVTSGKQEGTSAPQAPLMHIPPITP